MKPRLTLVVTICLLAIALPCAACEYPVDAWKTWQQNGPSHYPRQTWLQYATPEEAG